MIIHRWYILEDVLQLARYFVYELIVNFVKKIHGCCILSDNIKLLSWYFLVQFQGHMDADISQVYVIFVAGYCCSSSCYVNVYGFSFHIEIDMELSHLPVWTLYIFSIISLKLLLFILFYIWSIYDYHAEKYFLAPLDWLNKQEHWIIDLILDYYLYLNF